MRLCGFVGAFSIFLPTRPQQHCTSNGPHFSIALQRFVELHLIFKKKTKMGAVMALPTAAGGTHHILPAQAFELGPTTVAGGIPGFNVLNNVWYRDRTFFYLENEDAGEPVLSPDHLLTYSGSGSGTKGFERIQWEQSAATQHRRAEERSLGTKDTTILHGTTLFFNDGYDNKWSGYKWLYHMVAEALLGSLAVLSSVEPLPNDFALRAAAGDWASSTDRLAGGESEGLPDRLIVAWDQLWDARYGLPRTVAESVFGDDNLIEPDEWRDMSGDGWVYFERILLLDRSVSHRFNPLSQQWLKMALDAYQLAPSPDFFTPLRRALLSFYNIPSLTRPSPGMSVNFKRPKIVYVERQSTKRRFEAQVHEDLVKRLERLEKMGEAKVGLAVLEGMEKREQFKLFADADIILGIHGNGLTHELWMPSGGIMIEILPPGDFHYDYAPVSIALGHEHLIWQNDRLFPRDMWLPQNTGNGSLIHDGSSIPLDVDSLITMVEALVKSMTFSYH
ncbi:hypothetical protein, variant 1 [Cryptococcus amylolentus CBS 6039]|uniref:Glycosyltransferase 61 catalytic domain-containing protein n=2 Tax=Cryptococcus amylolentus TaxID=104669 RepID=A0A1E3HLM2_9TREE|nr:hypothetical protein, variant 1 [Cryptococcus amylolentus CBS 6039]ODN76606.1 hypothetical protein, variant 1 [Cryptococcus amylolentus CBS 6039]